MTFADFAFTLGFLLTHFRNNYHTILDSHLSVFLCVGAHVSYRKQNSNKIM